MTEEKKKQIWTAMQFQKEIEKLQDQLSNEPGLGESLRPAINKNLWDAWHNFNLTLSQFTPAILNNITEEAIAKGWEKSLP